MHLAHPINVVIERLVILDERTERLGIAFDKLHYAVPHVHVIRHVTLEWSNLRNQRVGRQLRPHGIQVHKFDTPVIVTIV